MEKFQGFSLWIRTLSICILLRLINFHTMAFKNLTVNEKMLIFKCINRHAKKIMDWTWNQELQFRYLQIFNCIYCKFLRHAKERKEMKREFIYKEVRSELSLNQLSLFIKLTGVGTITTLVKWGPRLGDKMHIGVQNTPFSKCISYVVFRCSCTTHQWSKHQIWYLNHSLRNPASCCTVSLRFQWPTFEFNIFFSLFRYI